jgi:putative FmdB family regulatory protein
MVHAQRVAAIDKYRFQGDRTDALRKWCLKGVGATPLGEPSAPAGGAATIGPMPIYEFLCEACGARFEELVEAGTESVDCGACASQRTRRVYSPQGRPFRIVKTPGGTRQQERRNAQLRERTKERFGAARRQARRQGGDS